MAITVIAALNKFKDMRVSVRDHKISLHDCICVQAIVLMLVLVDGKSILFASFS